MLVFKIVLISNIFDNLQIYQQKVIKQLHKFI